jgi:hypothetical protein
LNPTLGAAWIGEKLVSTDNTGPIGTTRVRGTVAADGGQSYAILLSKLFDLGPVFGSKGDPPAVISVIAGVGNQLDQHNDIQLRITMGINTSTPAC